MPNLANQDFTQFKREQQTAPAWFRILRGGRMTKWKGKVASYAPHVAPAIGWAFSRTLQLSLISLVMAGTAAASDRYWDSNGTAVGRGGSGAWNTSNAFWSPSGDGVSGPYSAWNNAAFDTAIFGGTAGTVTLGSPITVGAMTFETTGYILSGNTLTLGTATPTITTSSGTTTINSVLAGTNGLTKAGDGILSLTGANTFSGNIIVTGGTLSVNSSAALGAAANEISLANGAGLNSSGSLAGRSVTLTGGQAAIGGAGVGDAHFTGAGGLRASSSVTLSDDSNDYTGQTSLSSGGTLFFSSIGNLGEVSALGAPVDEAAGTISLVVGSSASASATYTGSGASSNRNWQLSSRFYANSTISNQGSGTLTLTGNIFNNHTNSSLSARNINFDAGTADIELLGTISSNNNGVGVVFGGTAGRAIKVSGDNTFGGAAIIQNITVQVGSLKNTGDPSALGTGTGAAGAISINSGILSYLGAGDSSDRNFTAQNNAILANDGTGALTLSGDVALTGTLTLGGSFAGTNTLAGTVSGTGNLRVDGAGSWILSSANTFTGDVGVNSGTLVVGNMQALGTTPKAATVNGGTLDLGAFDTTLSSLSGTGGNVNLGGATLTVKGSTSTDFAGSMTGSGNLLKQGTSTLTLTGASSFTGDTTINGGAISLNFKNATALTDNILSTSSTLNLAGGTFNVIGMDNAANSQTVDGVNVTAGNNKITTTSGSGGTLTLNLGAINRTGGFIDFGINADTTITTTSATLGGWATVNSTDYAKVDGGVIKALDESDYANKDDAGTWANGDIVSDAGGAANTPYFGTVGTSLQLGGLKYTAAANSTVTIAAGQTLGVNGTIIVANTVGNTNQTINGGSLTGIAGGGVLGVLQTGTGTFTIQSTITDNGGAIGFTKAGAGSVTLTGQNTYSGVTTLSGGILTVTQMANAGMASGIGQSTADPANLMLESGTFRYTGGSVTTDRGFTLVNGGPARVIEVTGSGSNLAFSGLVTSPDDAGFEKKGAGTLTFLNGSNDHIGATTVSGGTLAVSTLADGGQVSSLGKSGSDATNLILAGGALNYLGSTTSSDRSFTLGAGNGSIGVANAGTTLSMSGTAVGTGGLTKLGDGTLILSGTNTYTGNTAVNAGVLRAGSAQAFGPSGLMTVGNGASLELGGYDITVSGLLGAGTVDLGGNTLTSSGSAANSFTGKITGTGGFTRTGGSTQTLSGCNSDYTGKTTIASNGTLSVDCLKNGGQASSIGASSNAPDNLVLNNGTLSYTGNTVTTDRGFTIQGGTGAISVTDAATTLTFSGQVVGTGALQKRGTGTLVLMNSNSYRGGTSVDAGTLRAGSSGAFGGGSMSLSNAAGAILDLDGFDTSVTSLSGGGALGGNVALGGATLTISSGNSNGTSYTGAITGIGNFVKNGNGTQRLTGCASSYSGSTTINGGVLEVSCLADGGSVSSIGMSSADADNLVINGGVLRYTGSGDSTDRQFTLGASGGNSIESEGTGAILFTSNAAVTFAAANTAQTLTLTLAGTNTDDNELGAQLTNNGSGITSLTKTDTGTWFLTNSDSTYTGVTKINGGVLSVDKLANGGLASSIGASSSAASNLIIGNDSTLRYLGTGDTTDRLFTLASGLTYIESSGSGAIVFTDTGQVALADNNQARTIALGGKNTGDNTLAGSIGDAGTGKTTLAKNDDGTWVLTGNNTFTGPTNINKGLLKIGNGGTTGSLTSDIVVTDGGLIFNRSDTLNYGGLISGAGFVTQSGSGTTILTGANSYTGATSVSAGTLLVNGDQSAATGQTSVANGSILGGSGIIGGNVVVTDGALAPGSNGAGTLTINGSLALSAGSILSMQLGQAGVAGGALNDLIEVKGNLTLDGTLDVAETAGGSYGPGIYRLINYTGSLTDNGLDIGMLPNGAGAIQTAVAGQVNLLAGGTNFNFWDGDVGPKFNSAVDGGNGTWQNSSGNNNWTDATGNINASYSDGAFAIFTGTAGTVTIDNSLGQVKAEGMQFAIDSYAVTGDKLELTGPQSTIRVGDGTTAGAAYIATINSVLTGNTQLEKTDAGTLVLTGANSYTGGTAINGGTIRISSGDNLGVASSDISFDGGALNTTANIATDRAIILTGAGTLLTDASTTLSLSGPISGTGALTKSGTGTLLLSGTAAHTGGTTITAGTLQIGNGGTDGSIDGNIVNNGALVFDRAGTLAYTGSISGTGTLTKNGSSTLTMTGTSTYTGETTVSAGTLALQAGGQIKGTASLTVDGGAEVLIDGSGSQFATGAGASVVGTGTVTVRDGGTASFDSLTTSNATGTNSTITVAGSGSQMTQTGIATFGLAGTATVDILDGGTMISSGASVFVGGQLPMDATGQVTISGAGSQWTIANALYARRGSITVDDGGVVTAGSAVIGYADTGINNPETDLVVTGAGSRFETTGELAITNSAANAARGSITIADGGVVKVGGGALAMGPGNAVLNIGAAAGGSPAHAGTLDAGTVTMAVGSNQINFNHDDASTTFSATISGAGSVSQNGPGATLLTGNNSYAGLTTVTAGSLYIDGDQSMATGLTTVNPGGTLGGTGTIGGDVTVASGGAINPGSFGMAPGTLNINGDLTLASGSTQSFSFGQANIPGGPLNDLINVGGDLVLAGTLQVDTSAGGTMDPGIYRVFNYTGTLSQNAWTVNLPSPDFYVQTSVAQQINLVNTAGLALRFWDGADPQNKNNGKIEGGNGIWQAFGSAPDNGNDNWTETGNINAPFQDATFAVFTGEKGTVTVDDSKGAINVSGIQFVTDGYIVNGDAINLVGASGSTIRVGDGTTGGTDTVASIDAEITGASQLIKADMGTLILTGDNSYTGGTKITGGTLNTTADMTIDRSVTVDQAGTLDIDTGTTLKIDGVLSGAGAFVKTGAGRLELAGDDHTYNGDASIASGTLALTGALGGTMNVGIDGRLEATGRVGATTNSGVIALDQEGFGSLTVNGNYTGKDGRLEIATVLGDDTSLTNRLVIDGDTAGTTQVSVTNRGGLGAQTVEGIKIIQVGGASNGMFLLAGDYMFNGEQAVVAGAYGYRLYKGGVSTPADGNWYLRSALLNPETPTNPTDPETPLYQPGVPLYESYAGSLQQLNKLGTLQQRVGNRVWAKHPVPAQSDENGAGPSGNNGIRARIEAAHAEFDPKQSTSRASYDADIWKFQTGIDGMFTETASGKFIGGVYVQYGTVSSSVSSPFGNGSIESSGYGAGATLTWYGESDFYIDGVAQINWFDSDLNSATLGRQLVDGNRAVGYSLSVETGQKIEIGEGWSLTPQAQLAYSAIRFDDFKDAFDTSVSPENDHDLTGRLGLAINRDAEWLDAQGRRVAMHIYGIGNLYYGFAGASKVDVSSVRFVSGNERLRGGIGLGGTYDWADSKYSLYGETRFDTSLQNFGDSNVIAGSVGLRVRW
ncbi:MULTISPECIES: adhesin autotransporter BmaC [Brucella]|nr:MULTISPECIES: adhesin autotransporter BmaC [Brucella]ALF30788.1 phosphomannomutase [Brucella abortus 104M]ENP55672.1 autotransporter-associated beta strand [Brucella abortus 88/19]